MPFTDWLRAVAVLLIWGVNFITIRYGVDVYSPFMLGTLRFIFVFFPACLFLPRPKVSWWLLTSYGLVLGFLQFGSLFWAIALGMPVGITSLVMQTQVFFSLILAAIFLGERIYLRNIFALCLALFGLWIIHADNTSDLIIPPLALFINFLTALFFAMSNILAKQFRHIQPLSLVVWSALPSIPPFLICAYFLLGGTEFIHQITQVSLKGFGAIAFLVLMASMLATSFWTKLLGKYPIGLISPLALLIPIITAIAAYFILDEKLSLIQMLGIGTVIFAVALNSFTPLIIQILKRHLYK